MEPSLEHRNSPNVHDDEYRNEEENFSYAMQLVGTSAMCMSLQLAIELGVFDIIAKAGEGAKLSAVEISDHLSATNPEAPVMLDRTLRLLASYSVLRCSYDGDDNNRSNIRNRYSLTPVSKYFVTNEDGVSLGPLVSVIQDKVSFDTWHEVKNAVLEGGIPFNRAHGMHAFEYPSFDPRFNQLFNKAMYNHTSLIIKNILKIYKGFEHLKELVDVGGGVGVTLNLITSKYPHIKGINFDLPHVIEHAPPYPGVEHVGGDMFESVPSGEAIFMKWILHNWSDEHCLKLLKNCYKAIPDNGKVIVLEIILPVMLDTSSVVKSTFHFDVGMMTEHSGGKERSQREFLALATAAGFSGYGSFAKPRCAYMTKQNVFLSGCDKICRRYFLIQEVKTCIIRRRRFCMGIFLTEDEFSPVKHSKLSGRKIGLTKISEMINPNDIRKSNMFN